MHQKFPQVVAAGVVLDKTPKIEFLKSFKLFETGRLDRFLKKYE